MSERSPRAKWAGYGAVALGLVLVTSLLVARCGERPSFLNLRSDVDGPSLDDASAVLFLLHGYGGSISDLKWLRADLRRAGLPDDVAIVSVDGPYSSGLGRCWGNEPNEERRSAERLRALVASKLGDNPLPPARVFVAGFSQGAGIAADLAAVEPRIGALASLSACRFPSRAHLVERTDMRFLIAHGNRDSLCRVSQSQGLVRELEGKGAQVQYIEFAGDHVIPPEVVTALAAFVRG